MKNASQTLIAKRYASALLEAATEAKALTAVMDQAEALRVSLQSDDIASALANPAYTRNQRIKLAQALAGAVKAHSLLAGTLGVMAENQRLAEVPAMLEQLSALHQKAQGIVAVRVESATPLTDAQKVQLKVMLKAHTKASNVSLTEVSNPSLIGGFRAFWNGMVWEQSVRGRLSRLSNALLSNIHNSSYVAK